MRARPETLDARLQGVTKDSAKTIVAEWVDEVRQTCNLPEYLVIMSAIAADKHEWINPIEELENMVGKDKVIPIIL